MPKTGATRYQKFLKSERSKTKLKSKELPRGTNVTKTNFKIKKIIIKEQLKPHEQDEAVTRKKLNLKELLTRLNHFNVNSRTDGLNGLKELVSSHSEVLEQNLGQLLHSVTPLVLNVEKTIRRESLKVLHFILSNAPPGKIEPFFDIMCTYLRCAMTHIDTRIQEDSLLFLDVLLLCTPERVANDFYKIIPNFIDMISKLRVDSKPGRTLTVNLGSKITSSKWRVKVLHRLQELFDKFVKLNKASSKSNSTPTIQYFDENSPKHYPLFNSNHLANCHLPCFSSKNSSSDVNVTNDEVENFKKYLETLIPLLLETWLEMCPHLNRKTENITETMISEEAAILLKHLLKVIYLVWEYVQILNKSNPSSEICKWFKSKFRNAYNQHIVSAFPYNTTVRSTANKTMNISEVFVDAVVDAKMLNENLQICLLYINLNFNEKLKVHGSEIGLVLNYIERVFTRNKDSNNTTMMMVLTALFSTEAKKWTRHQVIDSLFDKIVSAYFHNQLSPDFHEDIFALLCKISLDAESFQLRNTTSFQKWIQNLPDILCCQRITAPTIDILHKFATQNNATFNQIIKPKLLAILKNLPLIKIVGARDAKECAHKLLSLLYWINGWTTECLNFLENQLLANAYGNERSKFIVDMLRLKSNGVSQ